MYRPIFIKNSDHKRVGDPIDLAVGTFIQIYIGFLYVSITLMILYMTSQIKLDQSSSLGLPYLWIMLFVPVCVLCSCVPMIPNDSQS